MKKALNQWLAFLDMERGDLLEMAIKENENVKEAVKNYNELTGDAEVKRLAEVRLMAQLEENAALASARAKGEERGMKEGREKGIKEGREEGIKEGLEKGKKEEQKKIAKKLIESKLPIEKIIEITGLSKDEIEKIKT